MEIFWITVSVAGIAILALAYVTTIWSSIENRRTPFEKRKTKVIHKLRQNESSTGTTTLNSADMHSLSRNQVEDIADEAGYDPARAPDPGIGTTLAFQRKFPPATGPSTPSPHEYTSLEHYLIDVLSQVQEDVRGEAWVDITPFGNLLVNDSIVRLLNEHGWQFWKKRSEQKRYIILTNPDSTHVKGSSYGFVNGPGLEQLREYPQAEWAAHTASANFGVDPLSDAALEQVKKQHNALYKRYVRWGLSGSVFLLPAIMIGLEIPSLISESSEYLVAVLVAFAIFTVPLLTCAAIAAKAQIKRVAAVRNYKDAYEHVLRRTFAAKERPGPD